MAQSLRSEFDDVTRRCKAIITDNADRGGDYLTSLLGAKDLGIKLYRDPSMISRLYGRYAMNRDPQGRGTAVSINNKTTISPD